LTHTEEDVVTRFADADTSDLPDFHELQSLLDQGLWVLYVAKEKLGVKRVALNDIVRIMRECKEVNAKPYSVLKAFARHEEMIHSTKDESEMLFEIMRPGKDRLTSLPTSLKKGGEVEIYHFEPGKKYSSKRILSQDVFKSLDGDLKIVDPYCDIRTLDFLRDARQDVNFLTRIANISEPQKSRFLRELADFRGEHPQIEFRSYPNNDLHDRYVISASYLVILGHSIKDIGGKESFAILLSKDLSQNVSEALTEAFERRWKQSIQI